MVDDDCLSPRIGSTHHFRIEDFTIPVINFDLLNLKILVADEAGDPSIAAENRQLSQIAIACSPLANEERR